MQCSSLLQQLLSNWELSNIYFNFFFSVTRFLDYSTISDELRAIEVIVVRPDVAPQETGFSFLDCVIFSSFKDAKSRATNAASMFLLKVSTQKEHDHSIFLSMKSVIDLFKRSKSGQFKNVGTVVAPPHRS